MFQKMPNRSINECIDGGIRTVPSNKDNNLQDLKGYSVKFNNTIPDKLNDITNL